MQGAAAVLRSCRPLSALSFRGAQPRPPRSPSHGGRGAHFETFAHRRRQQEERQSVPGAGPAPEPWAGAEAGGRSRLQGLLTEVWRAAKAQDWRAALRVLGEVPERPPGGQWAPLFYAVLACCCKAGRYYEACAVWEDMPERDEISYNMMINLCGRLRRLEEAKALFAEMGQRGLEPSGVTYCALLSGFATQAWHEEAIATLLEMKRQPRLDATADWGQAYLLAMSACARAGDYPRARQLLDEGRSERQVAPQHRHYNALMTACARGMEGTTARAVLAEMGAQGLTPREEDWNILIQCSRSDFAECRRILDEMRAAGTAASEETFAALLRAAAGCRERTSAVGWVLAQLRACGLDESRPSSPRLRIELQRLREKGAR